MKSKVALVTGASRGIGFGLSTELCRRGYKVLMVSKNFEKLQKAYHTLKNNKFDVELKALDLRGESNQLLEWFNEKDSILKEVDVIVNNAGVYLDENNGRSGSSFEVPPNDVLHTFQVNTLMPFSIIQLLLPQMKKRGYGRIVNVSSGMGSFANMAGMYPAYRISKAALNAVTRIFSQEVVDCPNIKINSICPGWVKTDMGGGDAPKTVEEAVKGIIWAIELDRDGPSGSFFRDAVQIPW